MPMKFVTMKEHYVIAYFRRRRQWRRTAINYVSPWRCLQYITGKNLS